MQFAPCSADMYAALGHPGYHRSCSENFRKAAAQVGWNPLHVPDPVNLFQRTSIDADGSVAALPALSRPGDSVTLRAEGAVYAVVTACSMDIEPINGSKCTPLRLELAVDVIDALVAGLLAGLSVAVLSPRPRWRLCRPRSRGLAVALAAGGGSPRVTHCGRSRLLVRSRRSEACSRPGALL